jgi:hypothetical protein
MDTGEREMGVLGDGGWRMGNGVLETDGSHAQVCRWQMSEWIGGKREK